MSSVRSRRKGDTRFRDSSSSRARGHRNWDRYVYGYLFISYNLAKKGARVPVVTVDFLVVEVQLLLSYDTRISLSTTRGKQDTILGIYAKLYTQNRDY